MAEQEHKKAVVAVLKEHPVLLKLQAELEADSTKMEEKRKALMQQADGLREEMEAYHKEFWTKITSYAKDNRLLPDWYKEEDQMTVDTDLGLIIAKNKCDCVDDIGKKLAALLTGGTIVKL